MPFNGKSGTQRVSSIYSFTVSSYKIRQQFTEFDLIWKQVKEFAMKLYMGAYMNKKTYKRKTQADNLKSGKNCHNLKNWLEHIETVIWYLGTIFFNSILIH